MPDCAYPRFSVEREKLCFHERCGNQKTEAESREHASPEPGPGL